MENKEQQNWEKEFDEKFSGLKSNGHKKMHHNNHNSHGGIACNENCRYVGIAIKDFIRKVVQSAYKRGYDDSFHHPDRLIDKLRFDNEKRMYKQGQKDMLDKLKETEKLNHYCKCENEHLVSFRRKDYGDLLSALSKEL